MKRSSRWGAQHAERRGTDPAARPLGGLAATMPAPTRIRPTSAPGGPGPRPPSAPAAPRPGHEFDRPRMATSCRKIRSATLRHGFHPSSPPGVSPHRPPAPPPPSAFPVARAPAPSGPRRAPDQTDAPAARPTPGAVIPIGRSRYVGTPLNRRGHAGGEEFLRGHRFARRLGSCTRTGDGDLPSGNRAAAGDGTSSYKRARFARRSMIRRRDRVD